MTDALCRPLQKAVELAALNVSVLLACVLLENALLGLWFALECKKGRPGAGTPERPRR